jgi:hypothetical protein
MTPPTPRRRVTNPPTPAAGAQPAQRYSYHGRPMPDDDARSLPDQLVIHDHAAGDDLDELMSGLTVRRRTQNFVPVPRTPDDVSKEKTA